MEFMSDQDIVECYRRDGCVVVEDIISNADLDPMFDFIASKVDGYAPRATRQG